MNVQPLSRLNTAVVDAMKEWNGDTDHFLTTLDQGLQRESLQPLCETERAYLRHAIALCLDENKLNRALLLQFLIDMRHHLLESVDMVA